MTSKSSCPCNSFISYKYHRNHFQSKKHLLFISNNPIKDFCEIYNEELLDNLNEKMNDLDENKFHINEGQYLENCNNLLKEFKDNKKKSYLISYSNLEKKFQNNLRTFNKNISEIIYKNNNIIYYHKFNNIYYIYFSINFQIFIFKIDYISYVLNTNPL